MSDDDKCKNPDYEPEFSGDNMKAECSADVIDDFEAEDQDIPRSMPNINVVYRQENENRPKHVKPSTYVCKPKKDRRTSLIWTKFTIINKKDQIAACNICDQRMSIKSTSHNLKKHLERKHGYSIKLGTLHKRTNQLKYITPTPRPKLSELAGVSDEGITVKVLGENGEEEHIQLIGGDHILTEEVVHADVEEHDYSTLNHPGEAEEEEIGSEPLRGRKVGSLSEPQSSRSKRDYSMLYTPHKTFTFNMDEKSKRQRILELQMECLENKKYNMQLEALLMEQQLNLPRSIFTESLRYADTQSRGTQTEVGGSETKVFYISDKRGGRPIQQLFAVQDLEF